MKKSENIHNITLFSEVKPEENIYEGTTTEKLKRLDLHGELKQKILPLCRLQYGEIWEDPVKGHRVGVLDATKIEDVKKIMGSSKA